MATSSLLRQDFDSPCSTKQREFTVKSAAEPFADAAKIFARDGYYVAHKVYSDKMLLDLEENFDRIVGQLERSGENVNARWRGENMDALDGGASTIIHTHNVQRYSARWLQALQDDRFLGIAQSLLGPDIVLHHTKLFQKPPGSGAPFPVHQDWSYFPAKHDTMIAATIFLSDADEDAGGMRVYPGSHKLGRLENSSGMQPSSRSSRIRSGERHRSMHGGAMCCFSAISPCTDRCRIAPITRARPCSCRCTAAAITCWTTAKLRMSTSSWCSPDGTIT